MSRKADNRLIQQENMSNLRELEQSFVDSKLEEMSKKIEEKKDTIVDEIIEYQKERVFRHRMSEPEDSIPTLNPLVINNYFFKPIVPLGSIEPMYNAEKLSMVFDYYMYVITEINDKIGDYPSSLTSFCKMAGITLSTLRSYKNSDDYNMRIITEKIYDQIGDENVTMSQLGIVKERSTMFKMRSQNELTEKPTPNININYTEVVDSDAIESRINKYKQFADKKK